MSRFPPRSGRPAATLATALLALAAACSTLGPSWPGGIGAVLRHSSTEHRMVVGSVPEDGPAAAAGLRADDEILAIDGRRVEDMDLREVVAALHGEVGSVTRLEILRDGEMLEIEITRAPYRDPD